eukprot:c26323_g1_i1 orf=2-499(-)
MPFCYDSYRFSFPILHAIESQSHQSHGNWIQEKKEFPTTAFVPNLSINLNRFFPRPCTHSKTKPSKSNQIPKEEFSLQSNYCPPPVHTNRIYALCHGLAIYRQNHNRPDGFQIQVEDWEACTTAQVKSKSKFAAQKGNQISKEEHSLQSNCCPPVHGGGRESMHSA